MNAYVRNVHASDRAIRVLQDDVRRLKAKLRRAAITDAKMGTVLDEDIRLNAIADERAHGPFIPVSLDDL